MVDPAPKGLVFGFPVDPVVNRATGEESHGGERENSEGYTSAELVGRSDQD